MGQTSISDLLRRQKFAKEKVEERKFDNNMKRENTFKLFPKQYSIYFFFV